MGRRAVSRPVGRWSASAGQTVRPDALAAEEPLEIRIDGAPFTVTMRTPGDDLDLVLGFLVSEGVIRAPEDLRTASYCAGPGSGGPRDNVINVSLSAAAPRPARNVLTTSACGVCGRTSIDQVRVAAPYDLRRDLVSWDPAQIAGYPEALRAAQRVFATTGGLHAAGLFAPGSHDPLIVREDVGRHNAVDKVIGWAFRSGRLPLTGTLLMVSGRASYELVQKAVVAGIPALAAVSAPSSLAAELATAAGLTLLGFVRGGSMNVYAGGQRLGLAG